MLAKCGDPVQSATTAKKHNFLGTRTKPQAQLPLSLKTVSKSEAAAAKALEQSNLTLRSEEENQQPLANIDNFQYDF